MMDTDICSDIMPDSTCNPTPEPSSVNFKQVVESNSNRPEKSGGKDSLALSTGRSDVGSKGVSKESSAKHVLNCEEMDERDDDEKGNQ